MKALKIWFLGTLGIQAFMWAYMLILSTVDPAAGWLIFIIFYAFVASLIQLPFLTMAYLSLEKRLPSWKWWHSFLLWLGTFVLTFFLLTLIYP